MEVYTHVEYTVGKYIVISPFVSILTAPTLGELQWKYPFIYTFPLCL